MKLLSDEDLYSLPFVGRMDSGHKQVDVVLRPDIHPEHQQPSKLLEFMATDCEVPMVS